MKLIQITLSALTFVVITANATTYWVATNGNDSNAGTNIAAPFATPQKAVTLSGLAAGDTIYVRGGSYLLDTTVKPKVGGASGNLIKLWAYPGERPVFDFSPASSTFKAVDMRAGYWHVKGIEVKYATDNGIFVACEGDVIEGCIIHDCQNDGLTLGSTGLSCTNALILNCDSYRNFQLSSGGNNGDGFSAKGGCAYGNVFKGCRAWDNADDGWDFYNNNESVTLVDCWAMSSGYDRWNYGAGFTGNGNGFKLGGGGTTGRHYLTNCVAFGNHVKGFDHNHSTAGQTMVNCTSYSNAVNFSFYDTPAVGTNLLINCVAFTGTATNLDPTTIMISNSWQLVTVTAADFASLNTSLATNARNADYSLPTNSLFRLAPGSQLIDKGVNVGLPYNGSAPDPGAFEYGASVPPRTASWFDATGCGVTNGGFRLRINGLTGHGPVVILANGTPGAWSPLFTNPPVTGSLTYLDTSASGNPQRFYRAEEK
jgi:hypothetical protein